MSPDRTDQLALEPDRVDVVDESVDAQHDHAHDDHEGHDHDHAHDADVEPVQDALEAQRSANAAATAEVAEAAAERPVTPWADLELENDGMPRSEDLRTALKAVIDPEIGYSIVDLGLVYEVNKDDEGGVQVRMTLTSMGCPLTEVIHQQCSVILGSMPGVQSVDVEFTFTPPWHTSMIEPWVAEELRALGMNV